MADENDNQAKNDRLVSLSNYIGGLWKLGGLPLVLIGIGAANIFVPQLPAYDNTEHLLVTTFMFVSGVVTWAVIVFLAYKRWKAELDIAGQRERQLIQSMCDIVKRVESDAAAKDRVKTLTDAVASIEPVRVHSLTIVDASTPHKTEEI